MARLNTRRRRSPKAGTRCKACGRRPSNVTISRSRSEPWATSSRPTRAPTRLRHSASAVEGQPRDLHPIVRDEIYKIAAEALRNAFRHAQAGRVEVEIRYDDEEFRLRVRDDGKGIDPAVLAAQGIEGHYGLRGMPERAARDWREAGGVERSRRRDGGGAAPSCQHRLRDIREALLVVAAVCCQDAGRRRRRRVMTRQLADSDSHRRRPSSRARRDRRSRGSSAGYDAWSQKPPTVATRSSNSARTVRT